MVLDEPCREDKLQAQGAANLSDFSMNSGS
jgi:hypothetical protein